MHRAHTFNATAAAVRVGDTLMIGGVVHRVVGVGAHTRDGGGTLMLASGIRLTLPPVATVTVTRPVPDTIDAADTPRAARPRSAQGRAS